MYVCACTYRDMAGVNIIRVRACVCVCVCVRVCVCVFVHKYRDLESVNVIESMEDGGGAQITIIHSLVYDGCEELSNIFIANRSQPRIP